MFDLTEFTVKSRNMVVERANKLLFTKKLQIKFLKDLSNNLSYVGAPLKILSHMAKHSKGPKQLVAINMISKLKKGQTLADGMDGWFDRVLIEAVRVGENQSVLTTTIDKTLAVYEEQVSGFGKAFATLVWPAMLLVAVVLTMKTIEQKFFPVVQKTLKGKVKGMPHDLQVLWDTIQFVNDFGLLILLISGSLFIGILYVLRNYVGEYRHELDRLPLFNSYKSLQGASFMQMYSILKAVNVNEKSVLEIARKGASPFYRKHLNLMSRKLDSGEENIADAINTGLIDNSEIERLILLSGSHSYVEVLESAASEVFESTITKVSGVCKILSVAGSLLAAWGIVIIILGVMSIDQIF